MQQLRIRPSVVAAPLGALLSTLAYKHYFEEPAMCDGTAIMLPIAGGFLGWVAGLCLLREDARPPDVGDR
jgi:hypothetical protein